MNKQEFLKHTNYLISQNKNILKEFAKENTQNKTIIKNYLNDAFNVSLSYDGLDNYDYNDAKERNLFYCNVLTCWYTAFFNELLTKLDQKHNISDLIQDWNIELDLLEDWKIIIDVRLLPNDKEKLKSILDKYKYDYSSFSYIFKINEALSCARLVKDFW